MHLDVNIWYPTTRQAKDINFPLWTIKAAQNARPATGAFPLLILSHASPADRFAYHNLAAWLACEGFVIAAPTHRRDYMDNMDDLFTWQQLAKRVEEIEDTIKLVLAEKDLAPCIDKARIGLIGFGSGAAAALLVGGAMPDCAGWPGYCEKAGSGDPYCSSWAKERMAELCAQFPLRQSLALPAIKAIAAIAPGFGMIFTRDSFQHFYPPLLLVAAGKDNFNRAWLHCEPIARLLGPRARFLDLPNADAGALIADCTDALAAELPELCLSMSAQEKLAIQTRLADTLLAFFSHYLVITGNLPSIPPPPAPEKNAPAPDKAKNGTATPAVR